MTDEPPPVPIRTGQSALHDDGAPVGPPPSASPPPRSSRPADPAGDRPDAGDEPTTFITLLPDDAAERSVSPRSAGPEPGPAMAAAGSLFDDPTAVPSSSTTVTHLQRNGWSPWAQRLRPALAAAVVIGLVIWVVVTARSGPDQAAGPTSTASTRTPSSARPPASSPRVPVTEHVAAAPSISAALRGRPTVSPVGLDEEFCRGAFRSGGLTATDRTAWDPGPLSAAHEIDDADARADVTRVMRRRFAKDDPDQAVADAMSLYDAPIVRAFTGDDTALKAALVELKGTIGEPVLWFVLSSPRRRTISFGAPSSSSVESGVVDDGVSIEFVIREDDRTDQPAILAPVVFRALLHQVGRALYYQEVFENVLEDRVLLEELRDDPEALGPSTDLSRDARWAAVDDLNMRAGTDLTAFRADVAIEPSPERDQYHSSVVLTRSRPGVPSALTPSGPDALTYVFRSMSTDGTVPASAELDSSTLQFLDANPGLTACDQLVAAQALGVLTPGSAYEIAARSYFDDPPS